MVIGDLQRALVEIFAVLEAVPRAMPYLAGKAVCIFVDSEVSPAALVKGYSAFEDVCKLVSTFWQLVHELKAFVYIDRVSTDANPVDDPSRGEFENCLQFGPVRVGSRVN